LIILLEDYNHRYYWDHHSKCWWSLWKVEEVKWSPCAINKYQLFYWYSRFCSTWQCGIFIRPL